MNRPSTIAILLLAGCFYACDRQQPIAVYTEPPPSHAPQPSTPQANTTATSTKSSSQAIWAAARSDGERLPVIFRVTADPAVILPMQAILEQIVQDAQFTATGEVIFQLTEDWQQTQLDARQYGPFASLRHHSGLEIRVSRVGGSIKQNVIRWCGQLGLPQPTDQQIKTWVSPLQGDPDGWRVLLLAPSSSNAGATDSTDNANTNPTGVLPAGWREVPQAPGSMRMAEWTTDDGCSVVVSRFPGTVGGRLGPVLDNWNRWRQQIGLSPLNSMPEDTNAVATTLAQNKPGAMIKLEGPQQSMLLAFCADSDESFFIKLVGPSDAANHQLAEFIRFSRQLPLPVDEGSQPIDPALKPLPGVSIPSNTP